VRTVREECVDKVLILNEGHLRWVMRDYISYYNNARPHQGIEQQTPIPKPDRNHVGAIRYCNVLGIINDYYRAAA